MNKASIISIGSELLQENTADTNSGNALRVLYQLGVDVLATHIIVDDSREIIKQVRDALVTSDMVIIGGGLGPTSDDITVFAVANALGVKLTYDANWAKQLRSMFEACGKKMPLCNLRQAFVLEGAIILKNLSGGTARGQLVKIGKKTIVLLPGPPEEYKKMLFEEVKPILVDLVGARLQNVTSANSQRICKTIYIKGLMESELEVVLGGVLDTFPNITCHMYALDGVIKLVCFIENQLTMDDTDRLNEFIEFEKAVASRLPETTVSFNECNFDARCIISTLTAKKQTLAVAESCTAGLLAATIGKENGASKVFCGGVVAYTPEVKINQLGIDADIVNYNEAVNEECAIAMAKAVRQKFNTTFGIGITGFAEPRTEDDAVVPISTIWIALATPDACFAKVYTSIYSRIINQKRAVTQALVLLGQKMGEE